MFQQMNSRRVKRVDSGNSSLNQGEQLNKVLSIESFAKVPVKLRININKISPTKGGGSGTAVRLQSHDDKNNNYQDKKTVMDRAIGSPADQMDLYSPAVSSARYTHSTKWRPSVFKSPDTNHGDASSMLLN